MANFKHLGKGSKMPETKNELVLYTNVICPYAQRAHLVLNAKKVPYHVVYMDLWKKAEWYTQKSPTGKVPALALTDQADPLIESLIIADYFDEKYPKDPLHPKNAYQKAHDRVFVERFNSVSNVVAKIMYPMARNNKKIENVDEVAEELFLALDPFETELGKRGSNFFGGDKTAMIDYMIWPWMERTMFLVKVDPRYGLNDDRFKNIISWRQLMCNDDAVKACFLTPEFFYEFYKGLEAGTPLDKLLDDAAEKREKRRQK